MELPGYERVASFGTAAEAEVVRGLLAASGIDARIVGSHLAREHIPSGEIAVLVPAADALHAREIIASARGPDSSSSAPGPVRRVAPLWRTAIAVGLSFSVVGALALLVQPRARETGRAFIIVGLLLAVLAALVGTVERARRDRRRE